MVTEVGSYLRLMDSCITQSKAQGTFWTCNDSKEEEERMTIGHLIETMLGKVHPTPYTLRPTPYTLHPTPYAPHPTPLSGSKRPCRIPLKDILESLSVYIYSLPSVDPTFLGRRGVGSTSYLHYPVLHPYIPWGCSIYFGFPL